MRQTIIDALQKKEVAKRDLGKNKTLTKIVKGETVSAKAIKLAYSKLDSARAKREPTKEIMIEIQALKTKVETQEREIEYLKSILEMKPRPKKDDPDSVLGFSIRIENTWTEGRKYEKYYAIKRIKTKLHRVYIGDVLGKAEEKIKAYCRRHGIRL